MDLSRYSSRERVDLAHAAMSVVGTTEKIHEMLLHPGEAAACSLPICVEIKLKVIPLLDTDEGRQVVRSWYPSHRGLIGEKR